MSFQRRSQVFKAWNIRSKQLTSPFLAGMLPLLLLWLSPMIADALSSSSLKTSFPTLSLQSVEATQLAIFDGPEWQSIRSLQNASLSTAKYGFMNVVVGKNSDGQQVIGIQCASSENNLYQESVVQIPPRIKKEDAIATYIAAISAVHAVLPKAEQVGGSEEVMIGGKVVILGGNELACFAAEGLASLGVHVCLVSSGNPKIKSTNGGKVETLKPAVGVNGIGFAAHVGQFDSLLDTISNERPFNPFEGRKLEAAEDLEAVEKDINDGLFASVPLESSKSVLGLLKSRHNCHTYVSTLTQCQMTVTKEGILGGPRQADEYAKQVGQQSFHSSNNDCQPILPWSNLGVTVDALLRSGVIFPSKTRDSLHKVSKSVRGWNLGDYWEQSTWPRDSSGSSQIRFGLPVVEDPNLDEEPLISEPPYRGTTTLRKTSYSEFDFGAKEDYLEDAPPLPIQDNPFVYEVAGVQGVRTEIIEEQLDCILFLSAKFCKTCRAINPQYTRMARMAKESSSPVVYAKAETSGRWGKELGRYLSVEAVPAFILFRKGERFGSALSVSKLPSRKIDRALQLLASGVKWDPDVLREDEKKT